MNLLRNGAFHYVLSMEAIFFIFGGIYFWFEKLTGRAYSEFLVVAGMPRRIPYYLNAFYIFNKIASWDLMFQLFL